MTDSNRVFFWGHGIKYWIVLRFVKLCFGFLKGESAESLHHENLFADINVSLELLKTDVDRVVLPQLFLKFSEVVVVLNIRLLLLLNQSLELLKLLFQLLRLKVIRNLQISLNLP
jgi:hypothetical protein